MKFRLVAVGWAVALVSLLALLGTADHGFVRDEGTYFHAARVYQGWFDALWEAAQRGTPAAAFAPEVVARYFGYNPEHPGLMKLAMGFSWRLLHVAWGVCSAATALRLPAMVAVAAGNACLFFLGVRLGNAWTGLLAVLFFMLCPRTFFHAHLGCFDAPVTAFGIIAVAGFWRAASEGRGIAVACLGFALALSTKHNAVLLPPALALAIVLSQRAALLGGAKALVVGRLLRLLLPMGIAGVTLLLATYPLGWTAPLTRLSQYYGYHLHHEHYPVAFWGTLYVAPPFPWSVPFVMTAITVPLPLLVLGVVGLCRLGVAAWLGARSRTPAPWVLGAWLVVVCALVPPLVIAWPTVPIFGGCKHWLPAMPFVALAGAVACRDAVVALGRWDAGGRWARWARGALPLGVLLVGGWETYRTHPLGHTYYNALIGGYRGAQEAGMTRTYWGGDGRLLLPTLNALAGARARVFSDRMNAANFRDYQEAGLLRRDLLRVDDVRQADWALINHQREYRQHERAVWSINGHTLAGRVIHIAGVPICSLYRVDEGETARR